MADDSPSETRDCDELRTGLSESGLPLPDPFPEYVACPHCGEPEVEVWCYQTGAPCHACGGWIEHATAPCYGCEARCRAMMPEEPRDGSEA